MQTAWLHPVESPQKAWEETWCVNTATTGDHWRNLYGDGQLLYPGVDGPIASIRLANIRDGLEDYEYLWLLAHRSGMKAARQACEPVTMSLETYTRFPEEVSAQREAIARRIEAKAR
jgi:hypothetical protein